MGYIKLKDILKEVLKNRRDKPVLGHGVSFAAYNVGGDKGEKVVKIPIDPDDPITNAIWDEQLHIFEKYPEFFPKIYKATSNYVILEKMDMKAIKKYLELYKHKSLQVLNINNPNLPTIIKDNIRKNNSRALNPYIHIYDKIASFNPNDDFKTFHPGTIFNYIVNSDPELKKQTQKLQILYIEVSEILEKEGAIAYDLFDFHSGNIGMDTQGNWKMVDF